MSAKRIIVPIDLRTELEIKGRIAESLQTRDFPMVHPTHPLGHSITQLYEKWLGERLQELMAIEYNSSIWLPTEELFDMFDMLEEFDSIIYNLMPTRELKYALLRNTQSGFTVEALPVGTLLFTLKDVSIITPTYPGSSRRILVR